MATPDFCLAPDVLFLILLLDICNRSLSGSNILNDILEIV